MLWIDESQTEQGAWLQQSPVADEVTGEKEIRFGDAQAIKPRCFTPGEKADEVKKLIWRDLGYRTKRYRCQGLPIDKVPQVLCNRHIIHATPFPQGGGAEFTEREEHWSLHHLPEAEAEIPSYAWKVIDLPKSQHIHPAWVWIAEIVRGDEDPMVEPRPLFGVSFDGTLHSL